MATKIWISEITFSDDSTLQFDKNDIIVFVGPNNSGKSASLKESAMLLKTKKQKGKVLKDIIIEKEGDEIELFSLLDKSSTKSYNNPSQILYQGLGFNIWENTVKSNFSNYTNGVGELLNLFVNLLTTEQRLTAANPAQNIKLTTEAIQHPIHYLQKDDGLEQRFSNYFRQAFGMDLIVHRNAGSEVPLYIGEKPVPKEGEDRVSSTYLMELEKLDLLHAQGDGMRGFVGVLLNAFISNHSILLIDEPEAFLHPPQARLLGKMLAKDLPSERQLFLATHSEDFLKGLLDANIPNLKIIRIERELNINHVNVLNSQDIKEIWDDSLLRHSNVLNGLFHTKVVICESDSDCRFFSAILSALFDESGEIAPDILFIHCGGKHRIPTAVKALKKLNVQIKVVADFDVLNDLNPIKFIFEDLGGDWNDVESDWKIVKTEIEQKRPQLISTDLKEEIESIFSETSERVFPKNKIIEIQKLLRKASAWSEAKEVGKAFIPSGNATQSFERIQIKLKEKGFYILEVGELESFVKSVGNHGPKWISEVLSKDLLKDAELETARQFVKQLI
ncbi:ATP-binding protein [Candidatus Woesearchaeota archaeon]|nr:ATP-binding protein [Candidatus Woesearchaeota archaeon]